MTRIRAAVLGFPIKHSLSPVIHNAAYEYLGWNWEYQRHLVASGELSEFLASHEGQFRGLSLTMPLKEEAISLINRISDEGKSVNSINTIIFDELDVQGHNTDIQGFKDALQHKNVSIPESAAVLGGGATARSAIAALDGQAKVISVYSRSPHRNSALVNSAKSSTVEIKPWSMVASACDHELIIATTPKGATDEIDPQRVSGTLFESLYDPWPTPLLRKWRERGGLGIDGLELLIWQALGQLELMAFDPRDVREKRMELYSVMRKSALQKLGHGG